MRTLYAQVKVIQANAVPGAPKQAALRVAVLTGAMPTEGQSVALVDGPEVYLVEKYGPQVGNACPVTVHNVPNPAALMGKAYIVEAA